MKKNMKFMLLNSALILGTYGFVACAHHDEVPAEGNVSTEKDRDVSENVFTGSKTVTDTETKNYQNDRTGMKKKTTTKAKVKYDKYGNKMSESSETDISR